MLYNRLTKNIYERINPIKCLGKDGVLQKASQIYTALQKTHSNFPRQLTASKIP